MSKCTGVQILLFFLCLANRANFFFASGAIHGQLMTMTGDENQPMHVEAYSREGRLAESVPVTPGGKFSMYSLQDGVYALSVVGSQTWAYSPMHVYVDQGRIVSMELRTDPLQIPGVAVNAVSSNESHPFVMETLGKANYLREVEEWSISSILGNKFMLLQFFALLFVVMFPRYLKTLDKETLAELTGEVEPDTGDPNEIIKALAGMEDTNMENEIVPAVPIVNM